MIEDKKEWVVGSVKACLELYMSFHVTQMKDQHESVKKCWSIGQEIYLANIDKVNQASK